LCCRIRGGERRRKGREEKGRKGVMVWRRKKEKEERERERGRESEFVGRVPQQEGR